jgi:cytochrome c peroxidase
MKFQFNATFYIVLTLVLFAFVPQTSNRNTDFKITYFNEVDRLIQTLEHLSGNSASIEANYTLSRQQFKRIEFLLAHLDRSFYAKHINGAPLPKLEKNVPDIRVIEPHGFQVMDEMIGETPNGNREKLNNEVLRLVKHLEQWKKLHHNLSYTNELILQAVHYQLIRMYTLGLTGFDTPGTLQGVSDSYYSMLGMYDYLKLSELTLNDSTRMMFEANLEYLNNHTEFESFDRADYYKNYWQPLYEHVTSLYALNKVRNWNQSHIKPIEVNATATHLFSDNWFNKQAFIDFNQQDLRPETVSLGRAIFFDAQLSSNGKMACATCHDPNKGFSDGQVKSKTISGEGTVLRNSPGLVNSIYTKGFFYDLRAEHLSQQFEHVIFSEDEFNTSLIKILDKLNETNYRDAFANAFPGHAANPVNPYTFKVALSSYIASLSDFNSSFDRYMRKELTAIDSSVIAGFNLFTGKAACATCHFMPTFSGLVPPFYDDSETEVLGVPATTDYAQIDQDKGRYSKQKPKELVHFYRHSFKTTSVRNASLTAPYMHNGVFSNLEEVLEFYNNGGGLGHGLVLENQTLAGDSLHLNDTELLHLQHFMEALEHQIN